RHRPPGRDPSDRAGREDGADLRRDARRDLDAAGGHGVGERAGQAGQGARGGADDMKKITPCLWFDGQAEQAAKYYTSIFKNSKILSVARYGAAGPGPKGSVMTVVFRLDGQDFIALNGGPQYTFSPAISLSVDCKSQQEVDALWGKLAKGGSNLQCGWLQDR